MTPDYQLDTNYTLAPIRQDLMIPDQLVDMPYENLPDQCAVGIGNWTPESDQHWSIVGPPTCSICLVLEGCGAFSLADGQEFEITPGSVFIFRTEQPTLGTNQFFAGHRNLVVDFRYPHTLFRAYKNQFLNTETSGVHAPTVLFQKRKLTRSLLRIAHEVLVCQMQGMARELFLRAKALEVLAYLAGDTPAKAISKAPPIIHNQLPIRLAKQVLEERYYEQWTIKRLAKEVAINERKLKEGFRSLLGTTFHRCLEDIRITHACCLLTTSHHSVTDIGLQTGYVNSSHFARVFRAKKGCSPRQWRDQSSNLVG